jgi:hypothetical protein
VATINQYKCQKIAAICDCENADNADYCVYDCYVAAGMESFSDSNPYDEDNGGGNQEQFNLNHDYVGCARWEYKNNRRQLEDMVEYFMGPYCVAQGCAIFLGLFTDDTCTSSVNAVGGTETYYLATTGTALPYGVESVIAMDCISCVEPQEYNANGNDAEDDDATSDMCEAIYTIAGKCESQLSLEAPYNNACTYTEGIKIIRKNGPVERSALSGNMTALSSLASSLLHSSFLQRTSTTSAPSSTVHLSTFPSKLTSFLLR